MSTALTTLIVPALAGVGSAPDSPDLQATAAPRRIAVVIGVTEYAEGLPGLHYADDDAQALQAALLDPSIGGFDAVTTLTTAVTEAQLWQALTEATAELHRDDLFLFYYAGHAHLIPGQTNSQLRLQLSDTLPDGGIPLQKLEAHLDGTAALQRISILDTCYSERTAAVLSTTRGPVTAPRLADVGKFEAWMFSAAPNQNAIEDHDLQHGVFTWYLLEGLSGAGDLNGNDRVELRELYDWVGRKTAEHTGWAQVPWLRTSRIGWSDLPLTAGEAPTTQAFIPWYAPYMEQVEVFIDGVIRGPGPLPPGRHEVTLQPELTPPLTRSVHLKAGEALDIAGLLRAAQPSWLLTAGLSSARTAEIVPPWTAGAELWRLGQVHGHSRWVLGGGATTSLSEIPALGDIPTHELYVAGGRWWQAGACTQLGPTLSLGSILRQPVRGLEAALTLAPGLSVHTDLGPLTLGISGRARLFSADTDGSGARLTTSPQATLSLGWSP